MFVALLVAIVVGLWILSPRRDKAADARIAQLEGRVVELQQTVAKRQAEADRLAHAIASRKQSVQLGDSVLRIGLRRAKLAAEDTATPPDTMRVVLTRTIEKVERYQFEVLRYQETVDSLLIAHVQERQALVNQVDTLTALLEAREPMRCAIWGVSCPNRTTAFLLGVGAALVLTLAVVL